MLGPSVRGAPRVRADRERFDASPGLELASARVFRRPGAKAEDEEKVANLYCRT